MERTMIGAAIVVVVLLIVGLRQGWLDGPSSGRTAGPGDAVTIVELAGPAAWEQTTLSLEALRGKVTVVGDPEADGIHAEFVCSATSEFLGRATPSPGSLVPALRWSDDGMTAIAEVRPGEGVSRTDAATRLTGTWRLTIPASMGLDIHTNVGEVTIRGVEGPVNARSDVGDVSVIEGRGVTTATSGVGDVDVESTGSVTASSGVGSVRVNGVVLIPERG